ncbi:MAG: type II toxin-antitoxin system VapC family toxin [Phycisphaerales bacterium]|nr:MAG: type II toxin-antitoxin system VapC family toxin [Phycisphaerales bacterium]
MTRVFADTGYWIAFLDPRDELHGNALRITTKLERPVQLVTTEMVLTEFLNAFARYGAKLRVAASRFVDALRARPDTLIIEQTHSQFEAALDIYKSYTDKAWGLTDCASYTVMHTKGLDIALTHDHHFEQMGFRALLRGS